MLESKEIINAVGTTGRYTREYYSLDLFKPVTTPYNMHTKDLEVYIKHKIDKAKDITKVFKNLEKQGYTVTTVKTVVCDNTPCFNTEIGALFNGNTRVINVLWGNKADYYDRATCLEDGYKQTIFCYIY